MTFTKTRKWRTLFQGKNSRVPNKSSFPFSKERNLYFISEKFILRKKMKYSLTNITVIFKLYNLSLFLFVLYTDYFHILTSKMVNVFFKAVNGGRAGSSCPSIRQSWVNGTKTGW